jgi:hypothetical protein
MNTKLAILCFVVMVMYCMLVLLVGILISLYCVTLVSSLIDNHWNHSERFYSQDYIIIDYNIARIKTSDDHWYIFVNDYVVPAGKCRDISMVVWRLYSGNVIINDYVVPAVKCRDISMVVWRLYSGNVIVNHYVVPDVKCRDIPQPGLRNHWL